MRSARRGAHATAGVHATAGARTIMRDRLAHAAGGYDDSFGKQIIDPRSKLAVPASDTSMKNSANWSELWTRMRAAAPPGDAQTYLEAVYGPNARPGAVAMLDVVYPWAAGASALLSDVALPEQQWQKYDPTGEWDWMAYLCCGISAAITNAAVTMVVANWWIKIDAQTTGGLCVATMLLTMWLYRTPPEDIALPLGKKAAKVAAADDVDIISTLASDANPNPGAAKRATKSPKRDKAALRFHE